MYLQVIMLLVKGAKAELEKIIPNQRGKSAEPKKSRPVSEVTEEDQTTHPENVPTTGNDIISPLIEEEQTATTQTENKPLEEMSLPQNIHHDKEYNDDSTEVDNEQSRSTIGREDFNDSTGSPVSNEAVFHEQVQEVKPRTRRKSGLDSVLFRIKSVSDADEHVSLEDCTTRQTMSESDIYNQTPLEGDQLEHDLHQNIDNEKDYHDDQSERPTERPKLQRARSQSTSCLEDPLETSTTEPGDESKKVTCSQSTNALDLQMTSGNYSNFH